MKSIFSTLKQDLTASIVVFLVAVPLCLGIALASDAAPFSGLIAGIVGGIIVGSVSSSAIGVSGPAAGLAVIVATSIHKLGGYELFLAAVVLAGIIQMIFGVIRAGVISYFVPTAVIKALLAAIGLLIIFKQLPHAIGYDKDFEGDEAFFQMDGENTFSEMVNSLNYITPSALIISVSTLLFLIVWERKFIQKTFLRFVPGPLLAVIMGILFTIGFEGTSFQLVAEHRVDLGIAGKPVSQLFTFPNWNKVFTFDTILIAFTIAIVASLETLLSVDASDKLDPKKRRTNTNRELLAQGVGNTISGLIGGLPVTQVVVRTSANVNSGGLNKTSAIVHGMLIAVSVLLFPSLFSYVPYATLAAILFLVGYKLAKPSLFKSMYKEGKVVFLIFISTILGIIFTDLLVGIGIGMGITFLLVYVGHRSVEGSNFFKKAYRIKKTGNAVEIEFFEYVSFLNKYSLMRAFRRIRPNSSVIINKLKSAHFASDIEEQIATFMEAAERRNIQIQLVEK